MAENRLDIILSAKTAGIEKSLSAVDARVRQTAKGIAGYLSESGRGAESLQDALESVEFSALADGAKSAAKDVKGAFDKSGDDLKKAFSSADAGDKIPDGFEKAGAAARAFAAGANKSLSEVGASADKAASDFGDLKSSIDNLNLSSLADQAAQLGDRLAGAADSAKQTFSDAGDEVRKFGDQIKSAFADTADQNAIIAAGKEIRSIYGESFDLSGIGEGAQAFKRFGATAQEAAEDLKRAAGVAKARGKDIADVSEQLGEAFAKDAFDVGIFEEIRASLGVSTKDLQQYGAQVDANGKILGDTTAQQRAAQKALREYIDTNKDFNGAADRTKTAYSQAQAEIDKFNQSVGSQVNELKEFLAGVALPVLKWANDLPDGFKTAAAAFAFIGGGAVSAAVALGQIVTVARLAGVNIGGLGEKLAGLKGNLDFSGATSKIKDLGSKLGGVSATTGQFATTAAGSAVVLGALAITMGKLAYEINEYNKATIEAEKSQQALTATQARASIATKEFIKFQRLSVDAIKAQTDAIEDDGERRATLGAAILQKESAAADARADGRNKEAAALDAQAQSLREIRKQTDASIAADKKAADEVAKAREDGFKRAQDAYKDYQKAVQLGEIDTKKAQLDALKGIEGGLSGEAAREVTAERKKIQAEILADEISNLKEIAQAENLSAEETKTRLQSLLSTYESTGDARKAIEKDVNDFATAQDEARFARLKALRDNDLALRRSALDLEKEALDAESATLDALEAKLDAGENVVKELEREIKGRAEAQKKLLEQEAALDRIAIKQKANADAANEPDKKNRQTIYAQAAAAEQQLNKRTSLAKAKVDADASKQVEAAQKKRAKTVEDNAKKAAELELQRAEIAKQAQEQAQQAQEQAFNDRRQQLEEEAKIGYDRSAELQALAKEEAAAGKKAVEEKLAIEIAAIEERTKAANIGASKEQQILNLQQQQLDIEKAKAVARQASQAIVDADLQSLKEQTAELVKQRQLLEEANAERKKGQGFDATIQGGAQSVSDVFGANASGFGVSRRNQATTADGKTVEDLDRQIKRNQGIINSRNNAAAAQAKFGGGGAAGATDAASTAMLGQVVSETKGLRADLRAAFKSQDRRPSNDGASFTKRFDREEGIR